jgi:hypothetical protein
MEHARSLEPDVWAAAEGLATSEQLARLEADPAGWRSTLERLMDEAEDNLDHALTLRGPERQQVVADLEAELDRLASAYERFEPVASSSPPSPRTPSTPDTPAAASAGEPRLQASWAEAGLVVWVGGPGVAAQTNEALADVLEAIRGPQLGWSVHRDIPLPDGTRTAALSIPIDQALGWLVDVGGRDDGGDVGASVHWFGHVALVAVRTVAAGSVVPVLHTGPRGSKAREVDVSVRWVPALLRDDQLDALARAMPGPVAALTAGQRSGGAARSVTTEVLSAIVDAIVREGARRLELPAPPPVARTPAEIGEAVVTRLDGSSFGAPPAAAAAVASHLEKWARPVTRTARPRLVVQLDAPAAGEAWFLSVLGHGPEATMVPAEVAAGSLPRGDSVADELARLERLVPALLRPGGLRRGQVYLSQEEAWELMTVTGRALAAAGFEVRVPRLSRRRPSPSLRLFTEPAPNSVVGAHQLSNVRWSAVFDDVELTAADVAKLAAQARPLVRSRGAWVELDRADLTEAAAALAERATTTTLTGAEILRHAVGLEGGALAGITVEGGGWARDLLDKAKAISSQPQHRPAGFHGELRSYQAEALTWLTFLDDVDLGGCLALDMGLGKTPTMLAHLVRPGGRGRALVIAPPAVVGNWAAEAARFTPSLRVVVHHGASRATDSQLDAELSDCDVLITTYGTAVRDVEALAARSWDRLILDEAQAIKNPANETAQQLRRIPARTRVALTGTPIENGLGDLWAILDFTNPGLVGSRSKFVSQMQGEGEAALRALNGILVFRRTKKEPSVAAELPDRIDELDHCTMTAEQIGLYQAVLDSLVVSASDAAVGREHKQGAILAAITALKQICNHPASYQDDDRPLAGRSGKLARLEEIVDAVFAAGERILVFTHFATWGVRLAAHLGERTGVPIACYHGGLARGARDALVAEFQGGEGPGALVLSLKAGGTGLNLTAASHVVLYDRWWNPAVEDQARDRAWRIGQTRTVVSHRLVCPGTVDERIEEVVAGKRHIADVVLPRSGSLADLDAAQLRTALGLRPDELLTENDR